MNKSEYLKRIGYSGPLKPTLKVLQALQKAHLLSIPFENLDIHYGQLIELEINPMFEKIVTNNRGGFCYELNGLFYELLTALGFEAKRISARVFDQEKGYSQEYDHMALLVKIEETEYLTDVGFGAFIYAPLKMELDEIQYDRSGNYIIDSYAKDHLRINKIVNGSKTPEYIFKNVARELKAFDEMCHYHQTNPQSHFTQKRLISVATTTGRITISGNKFKIQDQGVTKEVAIKNEAAFHNDLWNYFRVKLQTAAK